MQTKQPFNLKRLVLRFAITIIAIMVAVTIVPGINLEGPWWGLALVAVLLGLVNSGVRPLLLLLSLPFVILSLGFFLLFLNALMLYLVSWLAEGFGVRLVISSIWSALLAGLVIQIVSAILAALSGETNIQFKVIRPPQDK